ncbi:MAG: putative quinol monooxygenase [Candidatus Kariarchaeaceae archaeon]|jgi:quinol monooxygenase YgiN
MSIRVIVQIQGKEDTKDELEYLLEKLLQRLRMAEGCTNAKLYQEISRPNSFLLYESWEDYDPHELFLKELEEDGIMQQLRESLNSSIHAETLEEPARFKN